ncbi:MAG: DNA-directed RNA polymerase subunit beta' [Candidatus Poribacteria bacterium]|nr:DNA-directed RNA polymerase subunit beta' [Candidatus Poribacteria bacterium]
MMNKCSCAEVRKPETINYRTFRPERDGLFCEAIFGPQKDWECACGKYKRIKHKGTICDRCRVEVTHQRVRRERMGYIQLAAPVSHVWYFKGIPSRLGLFLDLSSRDVERVLYFEAFIVLEVSDPNCPLKFKQLLTEEEYNENRTQFPDGFRVGMGAAAVNELLSGIDLNQEIETLRTELEETGSKQKAKKLAKRLKLVLGFKKSGNRPEWMILSVIPVIPPDLRPLVALDGGRFATSDLNDLYRRVINRNNRLKRLMELRAPDVIIRNEKRMLQEAVDALLDNGRHGRMVRGPGNRPLKSLADMLKGKVGRFRQNLLGKRVDYSGRSVVVVGPDLQLHQCGLPKEMALELFKPFIIRKLQEKDYAHTIKRAKHMTDQISPEVWEVLEEVIDEHLVMLNRAPTLHRLGIQAFQPVLVEGKAIRVHPLVCKAFNADFDGDQMAVHVPLSVESQIEAKLLMMAPRNILKPAHGGAIAVPELDMVLGCSFLTKSIPASDRDAPGLRHYRNSDEVIMAHACDRLGLHDSILLHIDDGDEPIETTVGRVIFNQVVPRELEFTDLKTGQRVCFVNHEVRSKDLSRLVSRCFNELGNSRTVEFLDELKRIAFHYATFSGLSIGMEDLIIPEAKETLIAEARKKVDAIEKEYRGGGMSEGERYNQVIDVWHQLIQSVEAALFDSLEEGRDDEIRGFNPVHVMADSGARSKKEPIRQISGMRGLMTKPSGAIIEQPIESCFREGLSVLEYFISTHGARKGLADTAIKTASSGYLTRKLVDVAQDVMITMSDCGTLNGITKIAGETEDDTLAERIHSRTAAEDIVDPNNDRVIVARDDLINPLTAEKIEAVGITEVRVRSALTCEASHGVCSKCYGADLTTGQFIDIGEAVGIIGAQSIGEPGTQLTMRTFHTGGTVTAGDFQFQSQIEARHDGRAEYQKIEYVERRVSASDASASEAMERVVLSRNGQLLIVDENARVVERHQVPIGATLCVEDGAKVTKGNPETSDPPPTLLLERDPYRVPILTEHNGTVVFRDIVEGHTVQEDKASGLAERVIVEYKGEDQPRMEIQTASGDVLASYLMPTGAHLSVSDGEEVEAGTVLARLPEKSATSQDIVTGLPRVTELLEARRPKDRAIIAEIEGYVKLEGISRGMRLLRIEHGDVASGLYRIPVGKHLVVHENDWVEAGDRMTDGFLDPHDILKIKGEEEVQSYLVNEVQDVYRSQGEHINDKHIEVIVRQMLNKVRILSAGDTEFLEDDEVDRSVFHRVNRRAEEEGRQPAIADPILQGVTKAALSTESFISAASFQQTTNVLTKASVVGQKDYLKGLKENVIMGRLIPAGSGVPNFRKIEVYPESEELPSVEDTMLTSVDEDDRAAD